MTILEETTQDAWRDRESYWLYTLRGAGHPLLNKNIGRQRLGRLHERGVLNLFEAINEAILKL
jgi:hypothetical protein